MIGLVSVKERFFENAYEELRDLLQFTFDERKENGALFNTSAQRNLYDVFLHKLPADIRQHYNCNACRDFINKYGRLVFVDEIGHKVPALWPQVTDAPQVFQKAVMAMLNAVNEAHIVSIFHTDENIWGEPHCGGWSHFHLMTSGYSVISPITTASQLTAESIENYRMLQRALATYNKGLAACAFQFALRGDIFRGETIMHHAKWFYELHRKLHNVGGYQRRNLIWKAVATAPQGFTHVATNMLGKLLDGLKRNEELGALTARLSRMMAPTQYRRPKAAPSVGNLRQAEHIVSKLNLERSLKRRWAHMGEVPLIWQPETAHNRNVYADLSVFGHLMPKSTEMTHNMSGERAITFRHFKESVLPHIEEMKITVGRGKEPFATFVTAVHEDAKQILKWDNPVSWYQHVGGAYARTWNLQASYAHSVIGITRLPHRWADTGFDYGLGDGYLFILKHCKDNNYRGNGNALFPEILRSELHSVRKTIEAFSAREMIHDSGDPQHVAGILCSSMASKIDMHITVKAHAVRMRYIIDRWE